MSTVLWANQLVNGTVQSDQSDKSALYQHLELLDQLCQDCDLPLMSSYCDSTDFQYNMMDLELPPTMSSTDELMAVQGVWIEASDAEQYLTTLLLAITAKTTERPELESLHDNYDAIVEELTESLTFAKQAIAAGAKFNFSIVM